MPEEAIKSAVYQMSLETLEVEEIVGGDKKEPDGSETVVACCTVSSVPGGFVIWYRTDEGVEKAKLIFLDHNGETRKIREMRIRDRRLDAVVEIGLKKWYEQAPLFIAGRWRSDALPLEPGNPKEQRGFDSIGSNRR